MMTINILIAISIGVVGASVILGAVLLLDSICDADKREKCRLKRMTKKLRPCFCGSQPKFIVRKDDSGRVKRYKLYCEACMTEARYLDTAELAIKDWEHLLEFHAGDNVKIDEDYSSLGTTGVIVRRNFEYFWVRTKSGNYRLPYYAMTKLKTSAKVV